MVDAGFHGGIGIAYANSTQTARAICMVDVLLGCIGHAGGALNPSTPLVLGDLDPARFATPPVPRGPKLGSERYPLVDPVRGLCTTIGQSILAGDLCGLIVYASNPGAGYGNAQAWLGILQQLDLLVTIDIRWSETARASDFVLPDVTYLEADRGVGTVVGVNDSRVFYRNAVLPVQHDDTRPGREIFAGLAQACGVGEYFQFTFDDLAAARWRLLGLIWTSSRSAAGPTRVLRCRRVRASRRFPWMAAKLRWQATCGNEPAWVCAQLDRAHGGAGPGMFRLISGNRPFESHTSRRLAAQGAAEAGSNLDAVQMNADAATRMGIADGEIVELVSDMGRDRVRVETTPYLHPACIFTSAAPGGRSFGADAGGAQAWAWARSTIRHCVGTR